MEHVELSDRKLKSLKRPESGRIEVPDAKRKGLKFRLSATGRAVWMYEKRVKHGPKRKHTLGTWPALSLSDARSIALEIEAEAAQGIDRIAIAEQKRLEEEAAQAGLSSVSEVLDVYEALHARPNLRTADERLRQLRTSLQPHLNSPITDLTRKDLQSIVDSKAQTGRAVMANRLQAAMVAFAKWAWLRGYTNEHIGLGVSKATKEFARERAPSLDEVREIYAACDGLGPLFGPFVRLLILTGQRRSDISKLAWSEVQADKRRIELSGARTKNGKPHITHLSDAALEQFEAVRSYQTKKGIKSPLVFTTTGQTPISGISKVKTKLDNLLNVKREALGVESIEPWRFHDLRTSFATEMAEAGESEGIVDRILNHVASGSSPSAVARVYNRAEHLGERARVLDKWGGQIVGRSKSVVELRAYN